MRRRDFLKATGACLFPAPYQRLAAALQKKVKITDVKCMIVRGTWDWNLIKIETDSGLYGIGEAYWGWGVKDLVLNKMKPHHHGRRSAQRRQALHQDADAERRRGSHRRRHHDRRQRHRDRPLGPLRAHPAKPLSAIFWAAVSATAFASTAPCRWSSNVEDPGRLARPGRRRRRPKNGAGPPSSSRATACPPQGRSRTSTNPATIPTPAT